MNDGRTPRERLDALLTALEDEVLRLDQSERQLADESVGTEDIGAMRARMESMIHARTGDLGRRPLPVRGAGDGAPGARAKAARAMRWPGRWAGAMQWPGRWAGAMQGEGTGGAVSEVRMAFSGEPSEGPGKAARKAPQRERDGSDGGKHKNGQEAE